MNRIFIKIPAFVLISTLLLNFITAEEIRQTKRGVCANKITPKEKKLMSKTVTWFYNWYFKTDHDMYDTKKTGMEFIPMVWDEDPVKLEGMSNVLKEGYRPSFIMWNNEPNLKDQSFHPPQVGVKTWRQTKALADMYGIPVSGPHMALGSGKDASIVAYDPIEKKELTYTFMNQWLDAYYYYNEKEEPIHLGVHSYGDINELRWMIGMLKEKYNRPIWVSEFAWWGAKDAEEMKNYMIQAVDLFEKSPHVVKYAWFKAHMGKGNRMSLLTEESEELTELGEIYVNMPVYDPQKSFSVPGRIEAEDYSESYGCLPLLTRYKKGGFLDLMKQSVSNRSDYNLDTASDGDYQLDILLTGQDKAIIEVSIDGAKPERIKAVKLKGKYRKVSHLLKLKQGRSVLGVRIIGPETGINWFELSKK